MKYVTKDKWGRVDRALVEFHDSELNTSPTANCQITQATRDMLTKLACRNRMPVIGPSRGGTPHSADKGVDRETANQYYRAKMFLKASLEGHTALADALRCLGHKPLSTAQINKIGFR